MQSILAENKELEKYLSWGTTCRTMSRIFWLKPAEQVKNLQAEPEML